MFIQYEENINVDSFIDFLQSVIGSSGKKRKIYLIVDNPSVHHARLAKKWFEENRKKIAFHYLPASSPAYNPDEYLNQDFWVLTGE